LQLISTADAFIAAQGRQNCYQPATFRQSQPTQHCCMPLGRRPPKLTPLNHSQNSHLPASEALCINMYQNIQVIRAVTRKNPNGQLATVEFTVRRCVSHWARYEYSKNKGCL